MVSNSLIAFLSQFVDPYVRPRGELRMVLVVPERFLAFQQPQKLLPANFCPGNFHEERASPAGADQLIDVFEQILREQYVCALCAHDMCLSSVRSKTFYVKEIAMLTRGTIAGGIHYSTRRADSSRKRRGSE